MPHDGKSQTTSRKKKPSTGDLRSPAWLYCIPMENANSTVRYTVSSRDTIAGIALKFGMPVALFKKLNRLQTGGQIFPGQVRRFQQLLTWQPQGSSRNWEAKLSCSFSRIQDWAQTCWGVCCSTSPYKKAELKHQVSVDLGVPLLSALRSKFRNHYVSNPTTVVPSLVPTPSPQLAAYNGGFRARWSIDLGVSERDVYSESTWYIINKRTAVSLSLSPLKGRSWESLLLEWEG